MKPIDIDHLLKTQKQHLESLSGSLQIAKDIPGVRHYAKKAIRWERLAKHLGNGAK